MITKEDILESITGALLSDKPTHSINIPIGWIFQAMQQYAEERGQAEAIARNLYEMSKLKVPVVCVIIGEGASGGALGIGVGDRILMLENTWYSVISPESCSSILWRSWEHKEKAAEALKPTAQDLLSFGIIDGIVKEPTGGAHTNPAEIAQTVKQTIIKNIAELEALSAEERINQRIDKYSNIGVYDVYSDAQ